MKIQFARKIGILMIMSLMLAGCSKAETTPVPASESESTFETSETENADEASSDTVGDTAENTSEPNEIRYIYENIDINNLADGTYPVSISFDNMKRNSDSLALDFRIYTVVKYDPDDILNMKRDDIVYEYVDEFTTENYVVDTVNFPIDEVCVVNGGSERGEGITFTRDKSGFFTVSVDEGYTRNAAHGIATLEIPDSVEFKDNHDLEDTALSGKDLYDFFNGLSDSEKEYFNQNNTFITVSNGKITEFYRIYLP